MYEATGGLLRWRGVATLFLDANKPLVFAVNKGRRRCQTRSRPVSILNHPWCLCWIENSVGRRVVFTAALKKMPRHGGWRTDLGKGIADDLPLADNNGGIAITVAWYETSQHHDINKAYSVDAVTPWIVPKTTPPCARWECRTFKAARVLN
jgi:hypothetical protein